MTVSITPIPPKKKKKKDEKVSQCPFDHFQSYSLTKLYTEAVNFIFYTKLLKKGIFGTDQYCTTQKNFEIPPTFFTGVFLFGWFREVMFYCPSGNFWLGFGTEGSHCLAVKDCQWDSQKDSLFLCVVLTLTLSIFQTVLWIFPMSSSSH